MPGVFENEPQVKLLNDGRDIELLADFVFIDGGNGRWAAPAGAQVDGASIPRVLWTLVGSPLVGKYRNASIIHDWFCDRRSRSWEATHKVFYEGMIASDVPTARAKVMYFAVHRFGPRWEKRVSNNANLGVDERFLLDEAEGAMAELIELPAPGALSSMEEQQALLHRLSERLATDDLSLEEIAAIADQAAPAF